MNRLPYVIMQSYMMSWNVVNPFSFSFFCSLFSGEKCFLFLWFLFITKWLSLDTSGDITPGIALVWSMVCGDWFVYLWMVYCIATPSSTSRIYIFWWDMIINKSLYYCHIVHQSISSEELFFFFRIFYLSTRFLSFLTPASSVIFNLFPSFWLFLFFYVCCGCWLPLMRQVMCQCATCISNINLRNIF